MGSMTLHVQYPMKCYIFETMLMDQMFCAGVAMVIVKYKTFLNNILKNNFKLKISLKILSKLLSYKLIKQLLFNYENYQVQLKNLFGSHAVI